MLLSRGARDIPYLLKPLVEIFFPDSAFLSLCIRWLPVSARLTLHQNEFHIILYNGVRFVRFAEELGSVLYLIGGVGDLVPDDRVQVVESDAPADDADIGVQRKNKVTSEFAPRDADVADDAHQTATGNEDSVDVPPDLFQLEQKCLVVLDVAELVRILVISLEIPVGGRSYDEVDRIVSNEGEIPRISVDQSMNGCFHVVS